MNTSEDAQKCLPSPYFLNGTVLLIRPAENYPAHASSLWVFLKVIIVAKLYFDTANIEQTTLN